MIMRHLIMLFFTLTLSLGAFAQEYMIMVKSAESKDWGFINLKGEFVIKPQFSTCNPFSEGLALVFLPRENQYGFVNARGEIMLPNVDKIKHVRSFSDGRAAIMPNKLWGFIDTNGDLVIEAKYSEMTDFYGGYAAVKRDKEFFVIDKQGNETPIDIVDIKGVKHFSEGLAPYYDSNKLYGLIDTQGNVVVPAQFASVGYFCDGLAWAKENFGKIGYINKKGEWAVQPQFTMAYDFDKSSGRARVKGDDGWVYVNKDGETISMDNTDIWGDFHEGLSKGRVGELMGFYNANMEYEIEPQFENVRDFKNGHAAVRKNFKWGIIDKKGNWVIIPIFDGIRDVELAP